jgi:hypothetical protein
MFLKIYEPPRSGPVIKKYTPLLRLFIKNRIYAILALPGVI